MAKCEYNAHKMDDGTSTVWCATHGTSQIGVKPDELWLCPQDTPCTCGATYGVQHATECPRYPAGGYPAPALPGRVPGASFSSVTMILFDGSGERHTLTQVGWQNTAGHLYKMDDIKEPALYTSLKPVFVEVPNGSGL